MIIDSTTYRSPDYRSSNRSSPIDMIVLHSTETDSLEETAKCFMVEKERNVSVHYVVDRDGKIYQFVPENRSAYHAGKAKWRLATGEEVTNINSRSVGIEFQRGSGQTFTPEQIRAGLELTSSIKNRYNIDPQNVVAHSDVAPSRKSDPGNDFPWELWERNGLAANANRRGNDGRAMGSSSSIILADQQGLFDLNDTTAYMNYLATQQGIPYQLEETTKKDAAQNEKAIANNKQKEGLFSGKNLAQLLITFGISLLGGNNAGTNALASVAAKAITDDNADTAPKSKEDGNTMA